MPDVVFKFWGTGRDRHPEPPDFQNPVDFLEGGCILLKTSIISEVVIHVVTRAL